MSANVKTSSGQGEHCLAKTSDNDGCGWTNWGHPFGRGLPVHGQVTLAYLLGHPGADHMHPEQATGRPPSGNFSAINFTRPSVSPMMAARPSPTNGSFLVITS